jgi:SAM-dependent methyltransferase
MDTMSMFYRAAYQVGFHPWEDAEEEAAFVEKISELFEREERGRAAPFGRALDLGTGSGIWGVELAKRGWQVTGVDIVEKALRRARGRVQDAGVEVRLVNADVTALRAAGIGSGFRLVLDTGTFHGLNGDQRRAMGQEVDAIAADEATVLLLAWKPRRRGPLPRGVSRSEIEASFPGWEITHVEPSYFKAPGPVEVLMTPHEQWYRLRRARNPGDGRRENDEQAARRGGAAMNS